MSLSAGGEDALLPEAGSVRKWAAVLRAGPEKDEELCGRLCLVLDRYLEQAALLDCVLPELVGSLAAAALEPRTPPRHPAFVVLNTAAKVRGYKYVARLLPHDPATLRALVRIVRETFPDGVSHSVAWETQYVLLLWLSAAVLVPFPLPSILPGDAIHGLYVYALRALGASSKIADGACLLLAAMLTRKDMADYLADFMGRCLSGQGTRGANGPSAAAALARIFKTGRREELAPFVPRLVAVAGDFVNDAETGGMKLKAKLSQRMALVFLKERPCTWRYDRGSRLMLFGRAPQSAMESAKDVSTASVPNNFVGKVEEHEGENWMEPLEEDIVEEVVEVLLTAMRHRDTVVRWSAAKGIGRIAGRLPKQHAEDVVQAVLDLFTSPSVARADSSWHGGCLALAELARRGLILPATDHFDALFRVVRRAAGFDVRRGAHSVGAHVRDAACYVIWALARAYTSDDVAPYAATITEAMIPLALLDREVNCRRAASAAIQECVGRFTRGVIDEAIALVTLVDYYSLGDGAACYTRIAPKVCALAEGKYFSCILDELWTGKLVHWDPVMRSRASQALAVLASCDARGELLTVVFPRLLEVVTRRGDAVHRHGAVLGLAELTLALSKELSDEAIQGLRDVPSRLDSKGYFRGKVGDLMRMGACRLIECCARAKVHVYTLSGPGRSAAEEALSVLEHTLGTGKEDLAEAAQAAYRALCDGILCEDESWSTAVSKRILKGLKTAPLAEMRRGYALAAGALHSAFVTTELLGLLGTKVTTDEDVEVRRNAAVALGRLSPIRGVVPQMEVATNLQKAMHDYAVDERGDIGSWVREASMKAVATIFSDVETTGASTSTEEKLDDICLQCISSIARQVCEKITRTRAVAAASLLRLAKGFALHCSPMTLPRSDRALRETMNAIAREYTMHRSESKSAVTSETTRMPAKDCAPDALAWPDNMDSIHETMFSDANELNRLSAKLLRVDSVWKAALMGIIAGCTAGSAGNMGSSSRWAVECIHERALELRKIGVDGLLRLGNSLVSFLSGEEERLVVPAMIVLEYLVRFGVFSTEHLQTVLTRAAIDARRAWRGRLRDVPRVAAATNLLCELASAQIVCTLPPSCDDRGDRTERVLSLARKPSLEALAIVLAGPVPRLRRIAADGLYVSLVDGLSVAGSHCRGSTHVESVGREDEARTRSALDIIADTSWERLSVPDVRSVRNEVCGLLCVETPKVQVEARRTQRDAQS